MPAVSEKQKKAMFAAAAGKSTLGIPKSVGKEFVGAEDKDKIKGAGIMLITPQDEVLFLLRSPSSNHPEEWDLPGGRADEDETPEETARRETREEIGASPYGELSKIADTTSKDDSGSDVDFITFRQFIRHKFAPKLDKSEHTEYKWASLENPPEPLHPGVRDVVDMALGRKIAKDATQHWISTEGGSHILLNGEGEVIGGAGGKLNGKKFSPKSKSKDVTKFIGYTPNKAESQSSFDPHTAFNELESSPFNGKLSDEQRNKIAKSQLLYEKYGEKGEGSRGKFKEAARTGKLDHLQSEHEANEKGYADAKKAEKKEKNDLWKAKNLPKLVAAKQTRIAAEIAEKEAKIEAAKAYYAKQAEKANKAESTPSQPEKKNYLNVAYADKDEAKKHGAKWDPMMKKWYHQGGDLPEGLKKFSSPHTAASSQTKTPQSLAPRSMPRSMPTTGRIHEDDPSIWGSELLGHEGERWEDFHNRHTKFSSPIEPGGYDSAFDCGYTQEQISVMNYENKEFAMDKMAFDRASTRTVDQDGRMHVALTHISKANICPYFGSEIPNCQALGLDAEKTYMLYRDPSELEKAAPTANNIPLLNEHIPVSAEDHKPDSIVGATGSDAVFNAPYLDQSLVIWTKDAIRGVENGMQQEISCAYYYDADMTPGSADGIAYDGIMRNIRFNHVALVERGRAGPDVLVGDSINQNGVSNMSDIALSKKATKAKGALLAVLKPIMATDAQATIGAKLDTILAGVKRKNWLEKKPGIVAAIKPLLAKDADIKEVVELLDKLDSAKPDDDNLGQDDMDPKCEAIIAKLRGKLSDEDLAEIEAMMKAKPVGDEPPQTANAANANPKDQTNKEEMGKDDENDMMNQEDMTAAMDAAIKKAAKETEVKTIARMNGIAEARELVKPIVGTIAIACDSAEDVFKAALKLKGINTAGVHASAYKAMVMMLPKESARAKEHIAQDSASGALPKDILEAFPHMQRVSH